MVPPPFQLKLLIMCKAVLENGELAHCFSYHFSPWQQVIKKHQFVQEASLATVFLVMEFIDKQ